jgi:hypothetical protein
MIVSLTERSLHDSRHFDVLDNHDRERLHRYLNEEVGITVEQALLPGYRWRVWARYFMGLQACCAARQGSPILWHPSQKLRPAAWSFEIALVMGDPSTQQKAVLEQYHVRRLLLSFYKLKGINGAKLERFFT